jgi:hypothetical protein
VRAAGSEGYFLIQNRHSNGNGTQYGQLGFSIVLFRTNLFRLSKEFQMTIEYSPEELEALRRMFTCQICGKEDNDCRTLRLRYLYNLSEISDKFQLEKTEDDTLYSLRTCKDCRGSFLGLLRYWVEGNLVEAETTDPAKNIPVRVNGRTVMMNKEEWQAHNAVRGQPGRQPVRLKLRNLKGNKHV